MLRLAASVMATATGPPPDSMLTSEPAWALSHATWRAMVSDLTPLPDPFADVGFPHPPRVSPTPLTPSSSHSHPFFIGRNIILILYILKFYNSHHFSLLLYNWIDTSFSKYWHSWWLDISVLCIILKMYRYSLFPIYMTFWEL